MRQTRFLGLHARFKDLIFESHFFASLQNKKLVMRFNNDFFSINFACDNSQYIQFGSFCRDGHTLLATGIGYNESEAYSDALDQFYWGLSVEYWENEEQIRDWHLKHLPKRAGRKRHGFAHYLGRSAAHEIRNSSESDMHIYCIITISREGLNALRETTFEVHGTYAISNALGYFVQLSPDTTMARVKDTSGEISEWLPIDECSTDECTECYECRGECTCEDGGNFWEVRIDPGGLDIPLSLVMRAN